MKVAVSIPDPIFERAEALAARLMLSRSKIYAQAVSEYVARHTDEELTRAANMLADMMDDEDRAWLDAGARTAARHTEW
ncbi:MAG: hypothetical protein ACKVOP_13895 [Sphingomonadaceae bacterium]